jgi:hypothetical protein
MSQVQSGKQRPKYQLLEKCHLNGRVYDPESMPLIESTESEELDDDGEPIEPGVQSRKPLIVTFDGVPAYYMKPLNEAAKAMVEKHKTKPGVVNSDNPIEAIPYQSTAAERTMKA